MERIGEGAANARVRDLEGGEHPLREMWAERPVVLAFVRHFGWVFCREQAVQLHREAGAIHDRGAELVIVGNGNRHFARAFRDELGLTTPVYVDTEKEAYRALEMKRGLTRVLRPAVVANSVRAMLTGSRQKRVQGDPWQLGGVLVVLPDGAVAYRYLSEQAGDHPPVSDVLAALPPRRP